MTDQEINQAIAEACGGKVKDGLFEGLSFKYWSFTNGELTGDASGEPPNFFGDLNAMHEAEKVILKDYSCHSGDTTVCDYYFNQIGKNSDAKDRAVAFLRTLGKWVEK